jgi:hypothetical protein
MVIPSKLKLKSLILIPYLFLLVHYEISPIPFLFSATFGRYIEFRQRPSKSLALWRRNVSHTWRTLVAPFPH